MSKIVSEEFKLALPRLASFAGECRENTAYFEFKTGVSACSHIKHLAEKLIEALDEIEKYNGDTK